MQSSNLFNNYYAEASKWRDKRFKNQIAVNITIECKQPQLKIIQHVLGELGLIMDVKSEIMNIDDNNLEESVIHKITELNKNIVELNRNIEAQKLLELFNHKNDKKTSD